MFISEDDNEENHGNIILLESERNNFSNPVHDSMHEENHGLLAKNPHPDLIVNVADKDPESVDLLTKKHGGNIFPLKRIFFNYNFSCCDSLVALNSASSKRIVPKIIDINEFFCAVISIT